ncbi:hypothetical protein THTE_2495 [Thermogutta terrifontis]|uniref:Uncharacterized protein n=1 Tax=Thermogutta terrifontis TaxID=1331910 RepID=A0A286RGM4_9BACT|nr:glycoside hydrolase domain-containing protein [Thermogutta terrifontis]ASV75097.1 hypothetical protein THTE_2495 [Thermogutta terrifontis]
MLTWNWLGRATNTSLIRLSRLLLICLLATGTDSASQRSSLASEPITHLETATDSIAWHHPLYLNWGDYWRVRIPITVSNTSQEDILGQTLAFRVVSPEEANTSGDQGPWPALPIAGRELREIRVCTENGRELLWGAVDGQGRVLGTGVLPAGAYFVIPIECRAGSMTRLFVYLDNPKATAVPDHWTKRPFLTNGGMELGSGEAPLGWAHDPRDADHQAYWTNDHPHSGSKCVTTVVRPGAAPSWIATRQIGIAAIPGARYRLRAWVRAENVQGNAGWYVHAGNEANPMMIAPVFSAGGGTYDWKEIQAEFSAPMQATTLSVGTVLWGTGQAWFDDVSLEVIGQSPWIVKVGRPEQRFLKEVAAEEPWRAEAAINGGWPSRIHAKVFRFADEEARDVLVALPLEQFRRKNEGVDGSFIVQHNSGIKECLVVGTWVLWSDDLPAGSVLHRYLKLTADDQRSPAEGGHQRDFERLLFSGKNLVKNPSFEDGEKLPEVWMRVGEGVTGVKFSVEENAPFTGGKRRSARLEVSNDTKPGWYGWQQKVPVKAGRNYFVAGWLKCQNVSQGEVRIHLHFHDAQGRLTAQGAMTSIGPGISGTRDWTLLSGVVRAPAEATDMTIHLTTNVPGVLWHDAIVVAEVALVDAAEWETKPLPSGELALWQMPSVVKVFREDPPGRSAKELSLFAAKGEWEAIQFVVKSHDPLGPVTVEVDPPKNNLGEKLDQFQVAVVGFVPIDHPSNYFRSEEPAWYRKIPAGSRGSDGWAGWWPDPLLPANTFDLKAETAQPIWIIFRIPRDARPGDYRGQVRLRVGGNIVKQVPLRCQIWGFALPERTTLPAIYDVRLGPGRDFWGKRFDEIYPQLVAFMAERRLCPDAIRPDPVIRFENGKVVADFTDYDRVAEWYFDKLGLPSSYAPQLFYLFGWGFPPRDLFGQRPYPGAPPYQGVDRSALRPQYKETYQACLRAYWEHIKQRGWADRITLYISDEPFAHLPEIKEQMKALCAMIHEVDPSIPIYSSTWEHVPEWDGCITVWGLGHDGRVPPEKFPAIREKGAKIWYTTDGQMCIDTPYCAVERLLPHYCFHYGVSAYEFWGVAWNTYNPYEFGWHSFIHQSDRPGESYWVRYPNGDGYLIYPGQPIGYDGLVSSIRLEQAREGVEDYEYFVLLSQLIDQAKTRGRDTKEAEKALTEARQLVLIPNPGGRYSTRMLPHPERVEEVRRAIARAIEDLSKN